MPISNPVAVRPSFTALPALCLGLLALSLGCAGEPAADQAATPEPDASAQSTQTPPPSAGGQTVEAAGLRFTLPEGWQREQPSSNMRAAQASITGTGGPGQLTVFFFGVGGGGGVDANLNRWVGQMQDSTSEPKREQFESGDYLISTVHHTGTLKASTMGTFPSGDQPDYALLGAVVEGPAGPWFFKAVGPRATMDEQAEAFRTMLENVSS